MRRLCARGKGHPTAASPLMKSRRLIAATETSERDRTGSNLRIESGGLGGLQVKMRRTHVSICCPLIPRQRQFSGHTRSAAKCHVWTAPSWQGNLHVCRLGRCSHVFGLRARLDITAGHNALRGSGPGHNLAFDNALARVGCPDRRIDWLCVTCCSPSQPSHHAGCPAQYSLRRKCDGLLNHPGHHGPGHSGDLVGKRDGGNLRWPPCKQCRKPGAMLGSVDLGVADDGGAPATNRLRR